MAKMQWMKFFPQDYLYDTRILTPEERSLWMDLLCFMWNSTERGKIEATRQNVAQMAGLEWLRFNILIDSIKDKKVAEVTDGNEKVTIISRRMLREENERESSRIRKRRYDEKHSNALVTRKKLEAKKLEAIKDNYITASPSPKNGDEKRPLSDLQKVVKGWKLLNGVPVVGLESSAWDRVQFARCSKAASQLLDLFGYPGAVNAMEYVFDWLKSKKLDCTLETIVKHSDKFREVMDHGRLNGQNNASLPIVSGAIAKIANAGKIETIPNPQLEHPKSVEPAKT